MYVFDSFSQHIGIVEISDVYTYIL